MAKKHIRVLTLCMFGAGAGVACADATPDVQDVHLTWGGFVKFATLYSRYSDGAVAQGPGRDFDLPAAVPVSATPSTKQYLDMQAKETRLWFGVKGKVEDHSVGGYIEGDFISGQIPQTNTLVPATKVATNAYNPALRRAFLTYDDFLFGQDWTTFQNVDTLPETSDFIGAEQGTVFVRQPQIRYTNGGLQASLEGSTTTLENKSTVTTFTASNDNTMPDAVLRYNLKTDFGSYSLAGIARQLRDSGTVAGASATSVGGGASFAGVVPVAAGNLKFMLTSGTGIGRYVGLDTVGDALVKPTGNLATIPITAGFVVFHYPLAEKWTTNLIYSREHANLKDMYAAAGTTNESASYAANVFYYPIKKLSFSTELRYDRRNALASAGGIPDLSGNLKRVEFAAKYTF